MGESDMALLANLYSATEASCCCFIFAEARRSRSKSSPAFTNHYSRNLETLKKSGDI